MAYETKNGNGTKVIRSQYWAVVLYENEDPRHAYLFDFIKRSFEYASIVHSQANPNEPKTHRHLLYKTKSAYTIKGMIRLFGGIIEHVEPINNFDGYLMYMVHRTPAEWVEFQKGDTSKREYPISALEGSNRWIRSIENNVNYSQLADIVDSVNKGHSVIEHVQELGSLEGEKCLDFLRSNQFIIQLINQHTEVIRQRDYNKIRDTASYYSQLRESLGKGDISDEL